MALGSSSSSSADPPPSTTTTTTPQNPIPPQTHHPPPPPRPPQILYPVNSSGRGFIPKTHHRHDQTVTVANASGGFQVRSVVTIPQHHHNYHPYGIPPPDPRSHMTMIRPPHYFAAFGASGGVASAPFKGIPVSTIPKVVLPSSVSETNGFKELRDKIREGNFATIRDRKVQISDGASLYALCRSWMRNGLPEEPQPQYGDEGNYLPRPLPLTEADANSQSKKDDEEEEPEEDGASVKNIPIEDLLQRHIKRAKRVRARLREERLQRIARYKTRLALLLPPLEQYRNDNAAGN